MLLLLIVWTREFTRSRNFRKFRASRLYISVLFLYSDNSASATFTHTYIMHVYIFVYIVRNNVSSLSHYIYRLS